MDMISVAVMLFLIMDPLGNLPLFLAILRSLPPSRRNRSITTRASSAGMAKPKFAPGNMVPKALIPMT